MLPNRPCLIIAESGRALAASAARANIKTHVIDRFADVDTRCCALSTRVVSANHVGFCADELLVVLNNYEHVPLAGVVVGSGLESRPDVLDTINTRFGLLGNQSECIEACKNPITFFTLLDSLGIPYPEVQLKTVGGNNNWLVKCIGGAGGQHISYVTTAVDISPDHYFQKLIDGRSLSLVFIANGKEAQIIGLNETWSCAPKDYNFCYAGAITLPDIDKTVFATLKHIVDLLVKHLQLLGLCLIRIQLLIWPQARAYDTRVL